MTWSTRVSFRKWSFIPFRILCKSRTNRSSSLTEAMTLISSGVERSMQVKQVTRWTQRFRLRSIKSASTRDTVVEEGSFRTDWSFHAIDGLVVSCNGRHTSTTLGDDPRNDPSMVALPCFCTLCFDTSKTEVRTAGCDVGVSTPPITVCAMWQMPRKRTRTKKHHVGATV